MALLLVQGGYLRQVTGGKILLQGDAGAVAHVIAPPWRTASAGTGIGVVSWPLSPLDPSELKYYTIDWSEELNGTTDRISSSALALSDVAVVAGLHIVSTTNDSFRVTIWFEIEVEDRGKSEWNGVGQTHLVTSTITTIGGQIFERTASIIVRQLGQPI